MPLDLPIYLIVGAQPVSFVRTEDGGADLRGWDFKKKQMTREAASWDDVVDLQPGLPVRDSFEFSEGETVEVTKRVFDRAVRKLMAG